MNTFSYCKRGKIAKIGVELVSFFLQHPLQMIFIFHPQSFIKPFSGEKFQTKSFDILLDTIRG